MRKNMERLTLSLSKGDFRPQSNVASARAASRS